MSNIYDSANELSPGLRELPEIQVMAQTGQMPDASFQEKMQSFSRQIQENALLSDFFAKQQQLSIYLSDIEKIVFEPVSELLK